MAKVGRPPLYKNVKDMQIAIDDYFDNCDNRIQQVFSKKIGDVVEVINPEPYTMAGLAYHLGMDRDTLINYAKKDDFIGAIKRARDKVHMDVERRLMEGAGAGAIFNLKNNFSWKDRTETDVTSNGKDIMMPITGGLAKANVPANDDDQEVS